MKLREQCSCGAIFEAEETCSATVCKQRVYVAVADWRSTHQHYLPRPHPGSIPLKEDGR